MNSFVGHVCGSSRSGANCFASCDYRRASSHFFCGLVLSFTLPLLVPSPTFSWHESLKLLGLPCTAQGETLTVQLECHQKSQDKRKLALSFLTSAPSLSAGSNKLSGSSRVSTMHVPHCPAPLQQGVCLLQNKDWAAAGSAVGINQQEQCMLTCSWKFCPMLCRSECCVPSLRPCAALTC